MTETIEIEKLVRYNATDGDILVLTPSRELGQEQLAHLDLQMSGVSELIKRQYGKDVSTIVLPHGFKLELISVGAKRDDLAEAYTVEVAAREFAKRWEHESSSARHAAEAAFIAGNEFKAPKPVEAEPTVRLQFNEYLLRQFYTEGKNIRRQCWPPGDHISADGAEGGTLWYYASNGDEFIRDYKLGFHELGATDWEITD